MPTNDPNYVQPVIADLAKLLPGCDGMLLNLYAVLAMTRGVNTSLEDVHDAWAIWQNLSDPQHRSLVPFDQLTAEVQELDRKYMGAIHYVATMQHERRQQETTASRPNTGEGVS